MPAREGAERRERYWRDYAVPVLRDAGFRPDRKVYYRFENERGDAAVFGTRPYLNGAFRIEVAIAVTPITRLLEHYPGGGPIGGAAWATHLNRAQPGEPFAGDWPVPLDPSERDRAGAELASYVRDSAIPMALRLLDYDELLHELRHRPLQGMTGLGEDALIMALLVERGPSTELEAMLAEWPNDEFHQRATAYARRRLAELGH